MAASFVFDDAEVVFVVDDDGVGFHLVGGAGCLVEEIVLETALFRTDQGDDIRSI